jgi:hypothetical protein
MNKISELKWRMVFLAKRLRCLFLGCVERHESGWNMPDDWHSPTFCERCDASFDVYGYESTPYHLLTTSDSFIQRLKEFFIWDK